MVWGGELKKAVFAALAMMWAVLGLSAAAAAETIDWNTRPATNLRTGGTDSPTYGSAPTLLTVTTSGSISGGFDGAGPNTLAIEPTSSANGTTGYINSTMNASIDNETSVQTTTINFNEPVYNASVVVGDIDGGPTFNMSGAAFNDIVEFRATNISGTTVLPTSGVPVNASVVTWNAGTGRALSTNQNVTNNQGNVTVSFAGPVRTITIRHISGANSTVTNPTQQFIYIETVTFTRVPQLRLQKTSNGGTGTFNFDVSNVLNLGTTPWSSQTLATSVTTATAGVAVTGAFNRLYATATNTVITETGPVGWLITSSPVTCTDSNSAASGNPASFNATVSGMAVTVAATNVRPGAIITCAIVNGTRPTLQIVKQSAGGTGSFDFTSNNFAGTVTLNTGTANPQSSAVLTLTTASTSTTITEVLPSGWTLASASCTGMGAGGSASLSGAVLTLNAAATAATANIICTFTNNAPPAPQLSLTKSASPAFVSAAGQSISYSIAVQNTGNVTLANVTLTDPLGPVTCVVSGTNVIASLAPAASQTCSLTYAATQADFDTNGGGDGDIDNTATASSIYNGNPVTAAGSATVTLTLNPSFVIVKEATPTSNAGVGATVNYTYRVRNTGNQTITGITVSDAHNGLGAAPVPGSEVIHLDQAPLNDSTDAANDGVWDSLKPGDEIRFTASYMVVQQDIDLRQ